MNIADRIKRLRELFGITSNDLAKITGIHPVSIRKYETNKMVPGIEVIDKMCDALKLPRMIFEGFPKQHTNYRFTGDFYQQLFLLLDNETLIANKEGEYNFATGENDRFFSINQELAKYIKVKHGDTIIPLDELSIEINTDEYDALENYTWFTMYLKSLDKAKKAQESDSWDYDEHSETKEEYIARMLENAEKHRFDLMLTDHSWKQYMEGWVSGDVAKASINQEIANGGNYYTYVEKLDAPEAEKKKLIQAYEDAYIAEQIQIEEYPGDKDRDTKDAWLEKKMKLIRDFRKAHPDYPELARKHAIEEAEKARQQK